MHLIFRLFLLSTIIINLPQYIFAQSDKVGTMRAYAIERYDQNILTTEVSIFYSEGNKEYALTSGMLEGIDNPKAGLNFISFQLSRFSKYTWGHGYFGNDSVSPRVLLNPKDTIKACSLRSQHWWTQIESDTNLFKKGIGFIVAWRSPKDTTLVIDGQLYDCMTVYNYAAHDVFIKTLVDKNRGWVLSKEYWLFSSHYSAENNQYIDSLSTYGRQTLLGYNDKVLYEDFLSYSNPVYDVETASNIIYCDSYCPYPAGFSERDSKLLYKYYLGMGYPYLNYQDFRVYFRLVRYSAWTVADVLRESFFLKYLPLKRWLKTYRRHFTRKVYQAAYLARLNRYFSSYPFTTLTY